MKKIFYLFIFSLLTVLVSCEKEAVTPQNVIEGRNMTITNEAISTDYVGNGAQWGGYDIVPSWLGNATLSESDWNTLFKRIDFMRPPFLRIMISAGWAYLEADGSYNETSDKTTSLIKMLEYAQSKNIEITLGEWGHLTKSSDIADVDPTWVENSVKFLNYLVSTKGFTCIKTANIINEPNGEWSSTKGSYDVWLKVQKLYVEEMAKYPALASIGLMGPDVAIWDSTREAKWIMDAAKDMDTHIGLYDVHVYPKQQIVRNGDYTKMLQGYRDATPEGKKIVLGEVGFKYTEVDAELKTLNEQLIEADPFAGDDSNMMIYEAFYGIDMADAIIQSMIAGFSGALAWDMDDAMYNQDGSSQNKELKRWGFWNILGEELCANPDDENIRPWFYPTSLLCRYFPAGSTINKIELPNKKGVRAVMAEKDGKYTIAIVNSHYVTYEINLQSTAYNNMTLNKYTYKPSKGKEFVGKVDSEGFATPEENSIALDLLNGYNFNLEGESFVLFTNMD